MNYKNLTEEIRQIMMKEVESDEQMNNIYFSKYLKPGEYQNYIIKLKNAIINGNEHTLANSLRGCFLHTYQRHSSKGKIIQAQVPYTANETLALGEFNRYYMRALSVYAIKTGKSLRVYRAKFSDNPRPESESILGEIINPELLLESLRRNEGTPFGVNSGLSVEIV